MTAAKKILAFPNVGQRLSIPNEGRRPARVSVLMLDGESLLFRVAPALPTGNDLPNGKLGAVMLPNGKSDREGDPGTSSTTTSR